MTTALAVTGAILGAIALSLAVTVALLRAGAEYDKSMDMGAEDQE